MLRNVKIGDKLLTRGGEIVAVFKVDIDNRFPIEYTLPSGDTRAVDIQGYYYGVSSPNPYDIVKVVASVLLQPTKADSIPEIPDSPKPIIDTIKTSINGTKYTIGYFITLPNGTQLYQSDAGHIQLISQPGAPIWQQFN